MPFALIWLALSTHSGVPWIVPVLASVPFGTGTYFIFTSSFTYIVVAYRPVAASALASNTTMRTSFAAAFPLFAGQMYRALGTIGATLLLAGLTTAMAPLPYVHHFFCAPPTPLPLSHTHYPPITPPSPPPTATATTTISPRITPISRNQASGTLILIFSLFCPVLCYILWVLGPAQGNPVMDLALLKAPPDLEGGMGSYPQDTEKRVVE